MKISQLLEDGSNLFYHLELALVGPRSAGSSRNLSRYYILPHNLSTINWDLIENPEYLDKVLIYDLTNDQRSRSTIQALRDEFIKRRSDEGELSIEYVRGGGTETHKAMYGGREVSNAAPSVETIYFVDYRGSVISIGGKEIRIPEDYGYQIFSQYEKEIKSQ